MEKSEERTNAPNGERDGRLLEQRSEKKKYIAAASFIPFLSQQTDMSMKRVKVSVRYHLDQTASLRAGKWKQL
jgi:hypothetical protein